MVMKFNKAKKSQAKLRLGLLGQWFWQDVYSVKPCKRLGKKIAVVDTEHASAALYADEFGGV